MHDKLRISRITTRIAATLSVVVALAFPVGYFVISYQFMAGSLEAEAEMNARLVSGVISANPLMWQFEQVRLDELLARRPRVGLAETRRVFDRKGELVAENVNQLRHPVQRRSYVLLDAGVPAGTIEISRSLRPLLERTAMTTLLGLLVGFLTFRLVPYREILNAQKRLRDGNEFLNMVMESSTNAIVVLDLAGGIRMANKRSSELSGYPRSELAGSIFASLFAGSAQDKVRGVLAEISGGASSSVTFETELVRRGGGVIEISCGIAPFRQDGEPAGFVLCAEDITSRKRWEQQMQSAAAELEESNTELKSFAYIISHDLRAPLVNIKGFSGELNGAMQELNSMFQAVAGHLEEKKRARLALLFEQEVPEALDFINSSVMRMDRLINAVLKLSRLGHRDLRVETVPVREMVESILKSMSHQLEDHCATVSIGALPELNTDRIALEQILGNLLDNAVKYLDTARPGELEIYGESGASGTTIHIRDNGRGIAQEDMGKVFEIFRRAGRQDVQGEGMGLPYVKALVRKLRGQIWCHSEPGQGSTFSFSIPHDEASDQENGV
ncbi:MAG TPA: ATP-binding protein [Geomonas sp.]